MRPFVPVDYRVWLGLNEDENPNALKDGELSASLNCAQLGSMLGTRPGLEREASGEAYENPMPVTATVTGDESIQGIHDFRNTVTFGAGTRGTDVELLVVTLGNTTNDLSEVWTDDDTALAAGDVTMTHGQDNVWVATTFQDDAWFAGGAHDDSFFYVDPITPGAPTKVDIPNLSGTPTTGFPKFVTTKWGHMFVNGIFTTSDRDNTYNEMITRHHTIGTDPKTAANWAIGNSIGTGGRVGDLGGLSDWGDEYTTGFGHYQDAEGSWLLILTNRKIASIIRHPTTGVFLHDDDIPNGCVHQRAFVSLGLDSGDAIYMSNHGIHSLRQSQQNGGREESFLSWKIRKTFAGLNPARLHLSCGAYDEVEGWVLFAVTQTGQSSHDLILCLDVKNSRELSADSAVWYLWRTTSAFRVNCMVQSLDVQGKRRVYVGTVASGDKAQVGRFTRGNYTDWGTGYNCNFTTGFAHQGSPSTEKQLGNLYVDVAPPANYSISGKTIFDYGARNARPFKIQLPGNAGTNWGSGPTGDPLWDGFDWGSTTEIVRQKKLYLVGRFHSVAHQFSNSGTNQPFFVAGYTQEMAPVANSRAA